MARSRSKRESDDRIGNSVLESEDATENRTRQERRSGSGNVRAGRARTMREIGAVSSTKTGPDGPREGGDRTRAAVGALAIAALRQKSFDHAKGVIVSFRPFTLTRTGNV